MEFHNQVSHGHVAKTHNDKPGEGRVLEEFIANRHLRRCDFSSKGHASRANFEPGSGDDDSI